MKRSAPPKKPSRNQRVQAALEKLKTKLLRPRRLGGRKVTPEPPAPASAIFDEPDDDNGVVILPAGTTLRILSDGRYVYEGLAEAGQNANTALDARRMNLAQMQEAITASIREQQEIAKKAQRMAEARVAAGWAAASVIDERDSRPIVGSRDGKRITLCVTCGAQRFEDECDWPKGECWTCSRPPVFETFDVTRYGDIERRRTVEKPRSGVIYYDPAPVYLSGRPASRYFYGTATAWTSVTTDDDEDVGGEDGAWSSQLDEDARLTADEDDGQPDLAIEYLAKAARRRARSKPQPPPKPGDRLIEFDDD